ncbi:hypothetical protein Syun_016829 [Stephania yunnanensis]|uniref:RING-type E3 ubiquitin transferase n=1 Tax=Stephania yunnanensis TaxID=152371 RepID=A0AAP0P1U4_9MAGN
MDLARVLGIDLENLVELEEEIKLLKNDISKSNSPDERRILLSLERFFDNFLVKTNFASQGLELDFDDDAQIQPFKNFICPLTKEVMKEPVVLESSQTYERAAIQYWFERCIEDCRDPTCPVTGQVLNSLGQKLNISLAGAIEEWVYRNIDIQICSAVSCLSEENSQADCVERVLNNIYKISEVVPSGRYKIRNEGVVGFIVKMLKNSSKSIGSHLRGKALLTLLSMAKDEESKLKMLEEGVIKFAVHGLIGRSESERENAVRLLLEFSRDEACCIKIACEKGALVLLLSMAGSLEHPSLCNLAEEVLKTMEKVEGNVQHLANAGRFEPLLDRLHHGSDILRIEMASLVGKMALTNNCKEQIARRSAKTLVDMLAKPDERTASLQALYNLSTLDDNATILVDSGVLVALTKVLFKCEEVAQDSKESAALTIANIVSKPGHWELAIVNQEGMSMQSESIVSNLLSLLSFASTKGQIAVLRILWGVASSPQASESVANNINSCNGIATLLEFLDNPNIDLRVHALMLTRIISESLGQVMADELKASNHLLQLKDKLLKGQASDVERCEAASVISNLPLTDEEVKTILGISIMQWAIIALKEMKQSSSGRTSSSNSSMVEGLLGLILHFLRCSDPIIMGTVRDHQLMTLLRQQLSSSVEPKAKQRAALGLKYLSESISALIFSSDLDPQPSCSFFSSFLFSCSKVPKVPLTCPIHSMSCEEESQFCLLVSNCIKPLADLLSDNDTNVQVASLEALSTLMNDASCNLNQAVGELENLGVVDEIIRLFIEARPGVLQERGVWLVERILRTENRTQRLSMDQTLIRALVEAFRHGNQNTKRLAQDALTNLKQLSGVSGQNLNPY